MSSAISMNAAPLSSGSSNIKGVPINGTDGKSELIKGQSEDEAIVESPTNEVNDNGDALQMFNCTMKLETRCDNVTDECTKLTHNDSDDGYDESFTHNSEPSTMTSSLIYSPPTHVIKHFDEAMIRNTFTNYAFGSNLIRNNSPKLQLNGIDNSDEDDDDDDIVYRCPPIRSTSLRTSIKNGNGHCAGVSNGKKIVRFADAMGLDLESVRHIITDDLPMVPQSAFEFLKLNDRRNSKPWCMQRFPNPLNQPTLTLEFLQPGSLFNFLDRVRNQKVCLENCVISNGAGNLSIMCIIRVLNVYFEKSVTIRYTTNQWQSWSEVVASYIPGSCDGWSDKFTSTFSVTPAGYILTPGQRILFAIKYKANSEEFWDNNMGLNYSLIYKM